MRLARVGYNPSVNAARAHASRLGWLGISLGLAAFSACQDDPEPLGQLIVTVDTDMALPQSIDKFDVLVSVRGEVKYKPPSFTVDSSGKFVVPIPATMTLVGGKDVSAPVNVSVVGSKGTRLRTFRELVSTVPLHRTAVMRMPLQWLCDGQVRSDTVPSDLGLPIEKAATTCDPGFTCRAGSCVEYEEKSAELPDYRPQDVFGDASTLAEGTCFDTLKCMVAGPVVTPDANCTIARLDDPDKTNVALRVSSDGICDSTETICFVPLDRDPKDGWKDTDDGQRIQLPRAVCEKLREDKVKGVTVSGKCPTKIPGSPVCGDWNTAARSNSPPDAPDPDADPPKPDELATLSAEPCCPLFVATDKVYTCACTTNAAATIYAYDTTSDKPSVAGTLSLQTKRSNFLFGAAIYDDVFYSAASSVDNSAITLTPLAGKTPPSDLPSMPLDVMGTVYETASILVDASSVYVLASGTGDTTGHAVKVVKLTKAGQRQVFDVGGTQAVFQLDQDAFGIYVVRTLDEKSERHTSVVRLEKGSGSATTIFPEIVFPLATNEANAGNQGGYRGVRIAGDMVYALYVGPPASDGTTQVNISRVTTGDTAAPQVLWENNNFNANKSEVRLQGVVDGAVFFTRIDYADDSRQTVAKSTLTVLPVSTLLARLVASYVQDRPYDGLGYDKDKIYWMTASGHIYAYPRSELR